MRQVEIRKRTIMVPDRTFTGSNTGMPSTPVSVMAAPWEKHDVKVSVREQTPIAPPEKERRGVRR
jgi:hypothetical protein